MIRILPPIVAIAGEPLLFPPPPPKSTGSNGGAPVGVFIRR